MNTLPKKEKRIIKLAMNSKNIKTKIKHNNLLKKNSTYQKKKIF